MTDRGSTEESRRRRQLAEVFGDVLPETTSDELRDDTGGSDYTGGSESERWYRENRPPHHD